MKRILYASGSVLTGDAIASSVVRYARMLARAGSADTITIPVVKDDKRGTVDMLIGPSSQLMVEDAGPDPRDPFDDGGAVAQIDGLADQMENPHPVVPWAGSVGQQSFEDEV
jgi:hypothetical protein